MFGLQTVGDILERTVTRRFDVPAGVMVIGIGGSTLGGSGKTPLAIACAAELAAAGARVALVGHAYRADPRYPRHVSPDDALDEVGDEALLAARALDSSGAHVVVAPKRSDAIARAARSADILVLDGVAQLRPSRAALALLALDAAEPWGRRGALPPFGTLRAPRSALVAACDGIVTMTTGPTVPKPRPPAALGGSGRPGRPVWPSHVQSRGAWVPGGRMATWTTLRTLRVGLLTALARPDRIVSSLGQRGICPVTIVAARDHGPFATGSARIAARAAAKYGIDLWLATPKCALHAGRALPSLRVAVLDHTVVLHAELRTRLHAIARHRTLA